MSASKARRSPQAGLSPVDATVYSAAQFNVAARFRFDADAICVFAGSTPSTPSAAAPFPVDRQNAAAGVHA